MVAACVHACITVGLMLFVVNSRRCFCSELHQGAAQASDAGSVKTRALVHLLSNGDLGSTAYFGRFWGCYNAYRRKPTHTVKLIALFPVCLIDLLVVVIAVV